MYKLRHWLILEHSNTNKYSGLFCRIPISNLFSKIYRLWIVFFSILINRCHTLFVRKVDFIRLSRPYISWKLTAYGVVATTRLTNYDLFNFVSKIFEFTFSLLDACLYILYCQLLFHYFFRWFSLYKVLFTGRSLSTTSYI